MPLPYSKFRPAICFLLSVLLLNPQQGFMQGAAGAPNNSAAITANRETLKEFYEIQRIIAKERADWALEEEILNDRIALLDSQLKELTAKIEEEGQTITKADEDREKLQQEQESLLATEKIQKEALLKYESKTRLLANAAPDFLGEKLRQLLERLPDPSKPEEEIKASLAQRYQNVLGVLNELNKFHADLTVANERRTMPDGKEAEVETLYLGLSQAFYSGSGDIANVAGIGLPSTSGWKWEERAALAKDIRSTIEIYQSKKPADFVSLPLTVQ